ncbi:uncharacterized protein N7482_000660 [Penicillium canariense]|uniref:Uncharacterized protein n=1 Tax=Penicillium canariense TaxID=189055 RepID=A0A9W9LS68_9EURO|nr:uncharacterized protein N7482_000660 [Penicillium canariense]KAJ5174783.1 hypothetical protein N7482_000660 [Penicillium canariense]
MEVAESSVIGFPNPISSLEGGKKKKKKSHKSKYRNSSLTTAGTNGIVSSPPPEENEPRPSKRKRESEPGHKKKKKKKKKHHEAENDANEEPDAQDTNQVSIDVAQEEQEQNHDVEMQLAASLSKEPQDSDQNRFAQALSPEDLSGPKHEESPDMEPNGTPSGGRLKKKRGPRIGGKNKQKVGFFVEEEIKALEDLKIRFCNARGLEGRVFDEMVQHSERGGGEWPVPTSLCTKTDFWNDIYALIPDRDRRSVYRFMRRHFQDTTQKAHDWTPDQDEELIALYARHGPKYAHIARILGRSDDDVTQRWKNRLQHRNTKNSGAWSETELRAFVKALESIWNTIKNSDESHRAGKDIWEMDLKLIGWGIVSNEMKNARTRQQCADKWRKIRRTMLITRQTVDPNAVFDPAAAANKYSRWNERSMSMKSQEFVGEDDDDVDNNGEDGNSIFGSTPAMIPKQEFATQQHTVDLAQVAKEDSIVSSSPEPRDIEANGARSDIKTKKRKQAEIEEPAAEEDDAEAETAAPSSPVSAKSHKEDKQERKRRRRERKERRKLEAAAVADAVETATNESEKPTKRNKHKKSLDAAGVEQDVSVTTPEKKKKKKHRKSEANGTAMEEPEQVELSTKKSKKDKKKKRNAIQKEAVEINDVDETEAPAAAAEQHQPMSDSHDDSGDEGSDMLDIKSEGEESE